MMMADYSNRTLLGTARKMWRSGGFLGLWRGNLVSVVKVVPQSAIQYAVGLDPPILWQDWHATYDCKARQQCLGTSACVEVLRVSRATQWCLGTSACGEVLRVSRALGRSGLTV